MLRRWIARLRYGTPLAVHEPYAAILREIQSRRAKHQPIADLKAKQRQMLHDALEGSR